MCSSDLRFGTTNVGWIKTCGSNWISTKSNYVDLAKQAVGHTGRGPQKFFIDESDMSGFALFPPRGMVTIPADLARGTPKMFIPDALPRIAAIIDGFYRNTGGNGGFSGSRAQEVSLSTLWGDGANQALKFIQKRAQEVCFTPYTETEPRPLLMAPGGVTGAPEIGRAHV